jgi:hypothetical protein
MNTKNERQVRMIEYDMDLTSEETEMLTNLGLKLISNDKSALINYAVNHILMDVKDKIQTHNDFLKKLLQKDGVAKTTTETSKRGRSKKVSV